MKEKSKLAILSGGIGELWNAYRIQAFVLSSHGMLRFGGTLMLLLAYFLFALEAGGLINVLPCDQCWNAEYKICVHCKASTRDNKILAFKSDFILLTVWMEIQENGFCVLPVSYLGRGIVNTLKVVWIVFQWYQITGKFI